MNHDQAQANLDEDHLALMNFMFGHQQGRAYVWRMLEQCRVFGASFTGEPLTTAFNEGRRDVGIRLLAELDEFNPNVLTLMKAEAKERAERYHVIAERDDE